MKFPYKRQTIIGLCLGMSFWLLPGGAVSAAPVESPSVPLMLAQAQTAKAEIIELYYFTVPKFDAIMSDSWDAIAIIGKENPDAVIKLGNDMLESPENLSPQVKAKIEVTVQKAKEHKRTGAAIDPDQHAKEMEYAETNIVPRIEQNVRQLYTGAKPLILKLARKDPQDAQKFCHILQNFLPTMKEILPAETLASYEKMYSDLEGQIKDMHK